jgi:hypothetical protein
MTNYYISELERAEAGLSSFSDEQDKITTFLAYDAADVRVPDWLIDGSISQEHLKAVKLIAFRKLFQDAAETYRGQFISTMKQMTEHIQKSLAGR